METSLLSLRAQGTYQKLLTCVTIWSPLKDLKQNCYYDTYGGLTSIDNEIVEYECNCEYPDRRGESQTRQDCLCGFQYKTVRFRDPLCGSVEERVVSTKAEHIVDSGETSSHYWYLYTTNGRTWSGGLVQRVERRTSPYVNPPLQLLRTEETAWTQDLLRWDISSIRGPRAGP